MNYKLMVLALLVSTSSAIAQAPVPFQIGQCDTVAVEEDGPDGFGFQREEYRIPGRVFFVPGNFCAEYTYGGWEETMKLRLGEGAREYRDLIEHAVEVWNEAVNLPSGEPLIEIVATRPTNPRLPELFDSEPDTVARENLDDDENVIYFRPFGESGALTWGTTWYQSTYKMHEADIYINTKHEEEAAPDALILTKKVVDVDASHGAYVVYDKTYSVILHELGHAIGLGHIPVNGNVMGRNFGAGGIDQWAATVAYDIFKSGSPTRHRFVFSNDNIFPYMRIRRRYTDFLDKVEFFTNNAKLGEQEKMALACIYRY